MAQLEQVLLPRIQAAAPMPAEEAAALQDLANLGSKIGEFWGRLCGILGRFEVQELVAAGYETSFIGKNTPFGQHPVDISGEAAGQKGFRFLLDLTGSQSHPVIINGVACHFFLKTGPDGGLAVLLHWTPPKPPEARWVISAEDLPAKPTIL